MWHGMFLFLLGLITGLVEQRFTNIRMGLSAHLEGAMNGIFLVALGAIWNRVRLPRHVMMAAYGMALYGTYANWLTTLLGAAFGTAAASPITAAGHSGKPWQEILSERPHFDRGRNCPCSLGASGESVAGQRRLWMNEMTRSSC